MSPGVILLSSNVVSPLWTSQVGLVVKNLLAKARDIRDLGSVPGLRRSHGRRHGSPLQYSCLVNPMDRQSIGSQRVGHD